MNDPAISVVMPVYNEAPGLGAALERLDSTLATIRERRGVELILVDDGSTDDTGRICAAYAAGRPGTRVCAHDANRGLIEAMKTGARAAKAGVVVMLDADLSYAPDIIEPLADTLAGRGASVVIASPYMAGGHVANVPLDRLIASRAANWILSRCVGGRIKTFTGMVRAYDRALFCTLAERESRGEFNSWIVAELLREQRRIVEIPAALVWPRSRTESPPRMTWAKLWTRAQLVVETALVLLAANRPAAPPRPLRQI